MLCWWENLTRDCMQRLAASALCNLSANHDENKKLSRAAGLVDALITLLQSTTDDAVQVPVWPHSFMSFTWLIHWTQSQEGRVHYPHLFVEIYKRRRRAGTCACGMWLFHMRGMDYSPDSFTERERMHFSLSLMYSLSLMESTPTTPCRHVWDVSHSRMWHDSSTERESPCANAHPSR